MLTALQKDPAARFADADEFVAALQAAASRMPSPAAIAAAEAAAASLPPAAAAVAAAPPIDPLTGVYPGVGAYDPDPEREFAPLPPRRRPRWPWALLALALAALVLVAVLLLAAPERVQVPDVVGSSISFAQQRLEKAGFEVATVRDNSAKPRNQVVGQSPAGGSAADEGARVTLNISDGPRIRSVPDVVGARRATAAKALKDAGFKVKEVPQFSAAVDVNRVIAQSPSARSAVEQGETVQIMVSKGPQSVAVPDVVGRTEDAARAALEDAGFSVGVRRRESADEEPGTVLAQAPGSGDKARNGSRVTITVAEQPAKVGVPNVEGRSESAARRILERRGFDVTVRETAVTSPGEDGIVQDQSPGAGGEIDRGSRVTIMVGSFDPDLAPDSPPPAPDSPPPPPAP